MSLNITAISYGNTLGFGYIACPDLIDDIDVLADGQGSRPRRAGRRLRRLTPGSPVEALTVGDALPLLRVREGSARRTGAEYGPPHNVAGNRGVTMARHRLFVLLALFGVLAAACGRSDPGATPSSTTSSAATDAACEGVTLEATDVGVTADTITVTVMADTGSPLAPGLFQGNIDAVKGFAKYINANGGIGCRELMVEAWDSKLDPTESKNGLIEACKGSVAMVGNNALFNPDVSPITDCPDATGAVTGVPNLAALTADVTEACAPVTYVMAALGEECPIQDGVRPVTSYLGYWKYLLSQFPDARSVYLVPGDLPTTVLSSMPILEAQRQAGIDVVAAAKVSGRDEQAAYTPKVQLVKSSGANMVYDGSNDVAMISMRREAAAQGLTGVDAWVCTVACYTEAFKQAGSDVDGT